MQKVYGHKSSEFDCALPEPYIGIGLCNVSLGIWVTRPGSKRRSLGLGELDPCSRSALSRNGKQRESKAELEKSASCPPTRGGELERSNGERSNLSAHTASQGTRVEYLEPSGVRPQPFASEAHKLGETCELRVLGTDPLDERESCLQYQMGKWRRAQL